MYHKRAFEVTPLYYIMAPQASTAASAEHHFLHLNLYRLACSNTNLNFYDAVSSDIHHAQPIPRIQRVYVFYCIRQLVAAALRVCCADVARSANRLEELAGLGSNDNFLLDILLAVYAIFRLNRSIQGGEGLVSNLCLDVLEAKSQGQGAETP